VEALPPEAVTDQVTAVVEDLGVQAIKTGMLLNADIMAAVATALSGLATVPLVVDPVMVSRTGAQLIADEAIATLRSQLLPLATVLTPNRYEAQMLAGFEIVSLEDMARAATHIQAQGPQAVLVKGGGMAGALRGVDVWFDGTAEPQPLQTSTVDTTDTHGTGCTLAAAIAANLALGRSPLAAVREAKDYVTAALNHPLRLGRGQGPIGHFYPLLSSS
jgi:hydroxymethylpyrimidine/phosphomethylpyrimidine kinase